MAKRVQGRRKHAQRSTKEDGLAALHRDLARRLGRWRGLKAEFDRVHRAGLGALRRKQFDRVGAAIHHEQRLIKEQSVIIQQARAWLNRYQVIPRKP